MGVAMNTASRSACASIASKSVYASAQFHFSATATARPGTLSQTATASIFSRASSWKVCGRMPRCARLPSPTSPTFTLRAMWSLLSPVADERPRTDDECPPDSADSSSVFRPSSIPVPLAQVLPAVDVRMRLIPAHLEDPVPVVADFFQRVKHAPVIDLHVERAGVERHHARPHQLNLLVGLQLAPRPVAVLVHAEPRRIQLVHQLDQRFQPTK